MWADGECWRDYGPRDITPWLGLLTRVTFRVGHKPFEVAWLQLVPTLYEEARVLSETLGLGGAPLRLLYRKLKPHSHIFPHADDDNQSVHPFRRFHLPLITDPRIYMRWPDEGQEVHLAQGRLWEVRFDRVHEIHNSTDVTRIHVQVDQADATI